MVFSLDGSRYDQSTYFGRYRSTVESIDPRILFVSDAQVHSAQALLRSYEAQEMKGSSVTEDELWEAKRICDAVIHPSTGNIIHPLGRMAGFIPANIPLVAGMLNSTSVVGTAFWQWANQSYNSALNYANRSGNDMSDTEILTSYGIAVGTSLGIALSFRWLSRNGPPTIKRIASIPFVVPYTAVASAGAANVYFTRRPELVKGVQIVDENDKVVGVSKEAAKQGVMKTILSRSIGLPIPVLILPHAVMTVLPKSMPPRAKMFAELTVISAAICLALPAAIAIFPQKLEIQASSLEKEFQNLVDDNGQPVKTLYCNKGI